MKKKENEIKIMIMARPCKSVDEVKSKQITVKFNNNEYEDVCKKAKDAGKELAPYLREIALTGTIKPIDTISPEFLFQLGKLGNNINQIARRLNSNSYDVPLNEKESTYLEEIKELLKDIVYDMTK